MREDTNQQFHFSRSYVTKIANRFKREISVTLYEIIKESHRYKQIDNITGQIFREYDNRALVELIQNAHDASQNPPIKIILDETDGNNCRLCASACFDAFILLPHGPIHGDQLPRGLH